jgi:lipoprotein-anchoring transpeptidase ErfK/SrfK
VLTEGLLGFSRDHSTADHVVRPPGTHVRGHRDDPRHNRGADDDRDTHDDRVADHHDRTANDHHRSTTTTLPSNVEIAGLAEQPMEAVGGHSGEATAVVQARLLQLGFWNSGPDGQYGFSTKQAVMAFQKYIGLPPTGLVNQTTADFLTNFVERAHAAADTGTLVEIDKAKQLLFIVQEGKTLWTFNTSTGSGIAYQAANKNDPTKIESGDAETPEGLFHTTRERPEGWWEGDLGKIYRPKYFRGGVAVHGMTSVPNYPASHGCVRLSTQAMDFIWDQNLMPLHIVVWVHS